MLCLRKNKIYDGYHTPSVIGVTGRSVSRRSPLAPEFQLFYLLPLVSCEQGADIGASAQNRQRALKSRVSLFDGPCYVQPEGGVYEWSDGRALVATGSPFPPVEFERRTINIGQCNNAFVFPGVGLGVISSGARRVTNEMFVSAARALAEFAPALRDPAAPLYPALEGIRTLSRRVALAVAGEAQRLGLAEATSREELERRVDAKMWIPRYARYVRAQR